MPKESLEELAFAEYWDKRYAEKKDESDGASLDSFDWLKTFEKLRPFFNKRIPPAPSDCSILHLGCGNSVRITLDNAFTTLKLMMYRL